MSFLGNTDALIIDLRNNGGGSPEMVQFLCSFFLDNPRKHLNSFSYKEKEKLTQYWTYTYLPGKRLDKIDLYLLTSRETFSAAEEALRSYVGTYGPRTITLEGGSLFYQREGRAKMKMTPIADGYFVLDGIDYFRLKFIKEGNQVVAVEGHDMAGVTDKHLKSK